MATAPQVEEAWTPEPELRDNPPRRVGPAPYADLNAPNITAYNLGAGAAILAGIVLFILGATRSGGAMLIVLGIILLVIGVGLILYIPQKAARRKALSEHLVSRGVPIMGRIVSSVNMTGDSVHGRSVKYQVSLPGGEIVHHDVNADERALPKKIPGNATVLMDMQTSQFELYAALPFRAMPKSDSVGAAAGIADSAAAAVGAGSAPAPSGANTPVRDRTPTAPRMERMEAAPAGQPVEQTPQNPGEDATKPPAETTEQKDAKKPEYQGLPWE